MYRFVPNLPATEYEANLQVISSVKTVQVYIQIYMQNLYINHQIVLEILVCT